MPSRSNPNMPSSLKRQAAAVLKTKRKHKQHVISKTKTSRKSATGGVGKVKGTSQAIRKENGRRRRVVRVAREGKKVTGKSNGERMDVDEEVVEGEREGGMVVD